MFFLHHNIIFSYSYVNSNFIYLLGELKPAYMLYFYE
jgi:hypothetical protein